MKRQFGWVDVTVTNLDRAITCYTAVLGDPVKKNLRKNSSSVYSRAPTILTSGRTERRAVGLPIYIRTNGATRSRASCSSLAARAPHRPVPLTRPRSRLRRQPHCFAFTLGRNVALQDLTLICVTLICENAFGQHAGKI